MRKLIFLFFLGFSFSAVLSFAQSDKEPMAVFNVYIDFMKKSDFTGASGLIDPDDLEIFKNFLYFSNEYASIPANELWVDFTTSMITPAVKNVMLNVRITIKRSYFSSGNSNVFIIEYNMAHPQLNIDDTVILSRKNNKWFVKLSIETKDLLLGEWYNTINNARYSRVIFDENTFSFHTEMPSTIKGSYSVNSDEITINITGYSDIEGGSYQYSRRESSKFITDGKNLTFLDNSNNVLLKGSWIIRKR
jgi:hypothetical protein